MHLCVMKIWEELQLCAINIHFEKNILATMGTGPFKRYVTLRGEGGISKNVTERDRGVGGLLLRYVTQGCQHMNKWIY